MRWALPGPRGGKGGKREKSGSRSQNSEGRIRLRLSRIIENDRGRGSESGGATLRERSGARNNGRNDGA